MAKKNNKKESKKSNYFKGRGLRFFSLPSLSLPEEVKKYIFGVVAFILAALVGLSFFNKAGIAGRTIMSALTFSVGKASFIFPLVLVLASLVFFFSRYKKFMWPVILAVFLLILGIAGLLESLKPGQKQGGYLGYIASPLIRLFDFWITEIILGGIILIGALIFWYLLKQPAGEEEKEGKKEKEVLAEKKPSLIKRIFTPKFEVKELEPKIKESPAIAKAPDFELKTKGLSQKQAIVKYERPPLDLLDADKGAPSAGDIRQNSAVIKKTLENFSISVEMSEINIGPTVTQYTLKPAEGIKLSKITTLSNDLSLALAAHPIRIEAPIPGKSLVGVEIPNKVRAHVRLRELVSNPVFQNSISGLNIALGRDVSGTPVYADLARMPHLLVAGSTGTGKTIFLNSLIISLLYQNSPQTMRIILVDPKRVEFHVYRDIPHLLCPVILDSQKTINALKWLTSEMERRFEVLAEVHARDIGSFNEIAVREEEPLLPYIVVVIDELADLIAARGKEVEVYIVRLAQMARAVGIHLVVATQRPSVEVITGLIKANITSRVTFQVASQVDSRTVLDMAGAEKLLGAGDLLFLSAEIIKPKRIQGPYVSEKEVKRVVNYIKSQGAKFFEEEPEAKQTELVEDLGSALEVKEGVSAGGEGFPLGDDSLYEEAKRVVLEAKKASASLLQRRLRIGYARAARLIDMLEEKGVVGPADGAKPREIISGSGEIFINNNVSIKTKEDNGENNGESNREENGEKNKDDSGEENENEDGWKKI